MDSPYNTTWTIVKTDFRRECTKDEPQAMTKTRIHLIKNKEQNIRLICRNKNKSAKKKIVKFAANKFTEWNYTERDEFYPSLWIILDKKLNSFYYVEQNCVSYAIILYNN